MSKSVNNLIEEPNPGRFTDWPLAESLQLDPPVSASFEGLIAFSYNSERRCYIGFHQADGRHRLELKVTENNNPLRLNLPQQIRTMRLAIVVGDEEQHPNVRFLKDKSDRDFRWMLDLQNSEFYPDSKLDPSFRFQADLTVCQGTFFTALRNGYRLLRISRVFPLDWPLEAGWPNGPIKPGWDPYDISWPGRIMGLNIPLEANQKVRLSVNGEIVATLPLDPLKRYEIKFSNECREGNHLCHFEPMDRREANRNDFYFHRDVLSLSTLTTRYGVIVNPDFIWFPRRSMPLDRDPLISDSAPCMGAGFGKSGGLLF